ncbi:hypothetical protein [Ruminococcus flavefaciens]|uniref:hypothetical protein n=1 Tax=Ruminococcus flavefaciens TaxID=1265 RepID=UPI000B2244BA
MDNVQYVSLGVLFSGALTKDGELYIWGNNSLGCVGIESDALLSERRNTTTYPSDT